MNCSLFVIRLVFINESACARWIGAERLNRPLCLFPSGNLSHFCLSCALCMHLSCTPCWNRSVITWSGNWHLLACAVSWFWVLASCMSLLCLKFYLLCTLSTIGPVFLKLHFLHNIPDRSHQSSVIGSSGGRWAACVATTLSRSCWALWSAGRVGMSTSWRRNLYSQVKSYIIYYP